MNQACRWRQVALVGLGLWLALAGAMGASAGDIAFFCANYGDSNGIYRINMSGQIVWSNSVDVHTARGCVKVPNRRQVLVADAHASYNQIGRFDSETGQYLGVFASGQNTPLCLLIRDNFMYVTENGGNKVWRYYLDTGNRDTGFEIAVTQPQGMDFGPDGRLYVASYNSNTVYAVDTNTQLKSSFVTNSYPSQVKWQGTNLYIGYYFPSEPPTGRSIVYKYDQNGSLITNNWLYFKAYDSIAAMTFGPTTNFYALRYGSNGEILRYRDNGTNAVEETEFSRIGRYGCGQSLTWFEISPKGAIITFH